MKFNPRWIIGKTVAKVEMNPKKDQRGIVHSPTIQFTDGSWIAFLTEEAENCASDGTYYGTAILYGKPREGSRQ